MELTTRRIYRLATTKSDSDFNSPQFSSFVYAVPTFHIRILNLWYASDSVYLDTELPFLSFKSTTPLPSFFLR
jgi:hypothetical protein